jgi:hypothetical protein
VERCGGFKPSAEIACAAFHNLERLLQVRQDPNSPISIPMSTKSSNSHHKRRQERDTRWLDPSLLQEEGEGREKYYASLTKRACAGVRKTKSVRSFHKK